MLAAGLILASRCGARASVQPTTFCVSLGGRVLLRSLRHSASCCGLIQRQPEAAASLVHNWTLPALFHLWARLFPLMPLGVGRGNAIGRLCPCSPLSCCCLTVAQACTPLPYSTGKGQEGQCCSSHCLHCHTMYCLIYMALISDWFCNKDVCSSLSSS